MSGVSGFTSQRRPVRRAFFAQPNRWEFRFHSANFMIKHNFVRHRYIFVFVNFMSVGTQVRFQILWSVRTRVTFFLCETRIILTGGFSGLIGLIFVGIGFGRYSIRGSSPWVHDCYFSLE